MQAQKDILNDNNLQNHQSSRQAGQTHSVTPNLAIEGDTIFKWRHHHSHTKLAPALFCQKSLSFMMTYFMYVAV